MSARLLLKAAERRVPFDFTTLAPEAADALQRLWIDFGGEGEPHNDTNPLDRPGHVCIHEAGHAVSRFVFFGKSGLHLAFVAAHGGGVIEDPYARRDILASVHPRALRVGRLWAEQSAASALAGIAAEARYLGMSFEDCASRYRGCDFDNVEAIRRDWKLKDARSTAEARACALLELRSVRSAILFVAAALKTEGFINGDQIAEICDRWLDNEAMEWRRRFPKLPETK